MSWEAIPVLSDLIKIVLEYYRRVIIAMIALALGWIIGHIFGFLANRIIGKMGLETIFRKISVGRAIFRAGYTPGSFFAAVAKGAIYLFSILFAVRHLSIPLLTESVQAVIDFLPSLIGGVLILVIGFTCVDWIGEAIERGGTSSTLQPTLQSGLVRTLLYFVTITMALTQMKIDITILYIFAQAFAWSLAIAIGIALGWNLKDKVGPWLERMIREEKAEDAA